MAAASPLRLEGLQSHDTTLVGQRVISLDVASDGMIELTSDNSIGLCSVDARLHESANWKHPDVKSIKNCEGENEQGENISKRPSDSMYQPLTPSYGVA